MAAVLASLAAFLAGCGLPGLPGFGGGGFVARDPTQEHELGGGDRAGTVWVPNRQVTGLDVAAAVAKVLARKSAGAATVAAEPRPAAAGACALSQAEPPPVSRTVAPPALDGSGPPAARGGLRKRGPAPAEGAAVRRVRFDLEKCTEHEVVPYAEVYGIHPRDFDFGRGRVSPRAARFAPDGARPAGRGRGWDGDEGSSDSDEEDDHERWRVKPRLLLGLRPLPRHLWCTACVLCFLLRAFGVQVFLEILPGGWQPKVA